MSVMSASPIFGTQAQRQKTTTWPLGCPAWDSNSKIVAGLIFDGQNPKLVRWFGGWFSQELWEIGLSNMAGWWFGTWILCFLILGIMIPTDEPIFFRGVGIPPSQQEISSMFNPFHPKMMLWSLIEHGRNKTTQSKVTIQHHQKLRIKISITIKHHDKLKHYHAHLASHAQLQGQACAIAVCDWPGLWSTNRQWGRWFKLLHLHLYSIYICIYYLIVFDVFLSSITFSMTYSSYWLHPLGEQSPNGDGSKPIIAIHC